MKSQSEDVEWLEVLPAPTSCCRESSRSGPQWRGHRLQPWVPGAWLLGSRLRSAWRRPASRHRYARAPARCRALQEDAHCVLRRSQGGSTWRDSVGRSGPVGSGSMADPVAELRSAVEAAASALRDGADAGSSAPTLERPPKPELGDYSTNAAMLLAPALGEQPRGIAEKLAAELGRSLEGERRAGRGRRPRLPQPLPLRRLVPAGRWRAGRAGRAARPARRRRRGDRADHGRVRLRQPDRPADRRGRPRHAAYGDSVARVARVRRPRGRRASTTSTTAAARSTASPPRSPPG